MSFLGFLFLLKLTFSLNIQTLSLIKGIQNEDSIYHKLIDASKQFFEERLNQTLESDTCYQFLMSDETKTKTILRNIFEYSGEEISDLGNEAECDKLKYQYYIFIYTFYNFTSSSFEFNDTKKNELFSLVNSDINFYTGLCLPNECSALLSKGFNQSIISNSLLQTYFNESLNIKSMKYVAKDDKNNIETRYSSHNAYFLLVGIPILIYLGFQVISAIVLELFIKSSEDKIKQVKLESEKKETRKRSQSRRRASTTKSVPKNENNDDLLFTQTYYNTSLSITSDINKKGLCYKIINFFSLTTNIKTLSDTKNSLYNEKNLKILSLVKTILLYFLVYNHNWYSTTKYPNKDFFNDKFYKSYWFSTIKITCFSADCFVALDAFTMMFKLMNFMKKYHFEKSEKLSYVLFKFFLLSIPKVLLFIANFYVLHFFIPNFSNLFDLGTWHQFYIKTIVNEKECEKNQELIFIPFYLAYFDFFKETKNTFNNCFRFVNVFLNEFYIFIIFLILFYVMNKIQSKIFDKIIAILVVLGTILSFLSFQLGFAIEPKQYNFFMILGQNLTLKLPHLFVNTYMLGAFTGLIYFYYLDVVSNRALTTEQTYIPFSFCFGLMKFFDSFSIVMKCIFIIITIFIQILFSMTYNIIRPSSSLSFTVEPWMKYLDEYDKQIFLLFFLMMTLLLMISSKDSIIRNIASFHIFNFISRIGFSIFSSLDSIIYLCYVFINFQNSMTYQNMLFISIGEFAIIIFICGLVTIIFELPLRMFIKYLQKLNNTNSIEDVLDSSFLAATKDRDD